MREGGMELVLGILIGVACSAAFVYWRRERSVQEEISSLSLIQVTMRASLDLNALVEMIYLQVQRALDVQHFTIALNDPGRHMVDFPIVIQDGEAASHPSRPPANTLIDHVIESQSPLLIRENVAQKAKSMERDPFNASSWLGVPLLSTDRSLGCMVVWSHERTFTSKDERVLAAIAAQASVAIENTKLYERTQRHAHQLRRLTTTTSILGSTLVPSKVMEATVKQTLPVIGAQAAAIFSLEGGVAKLEAAEGVPQDFFENPIPPLLAEEEELERRRSPLVIKDINNSVAPIKAAVQAMDKRTVAEIPLRLRQPFGILVLYFDEPTHIDTNLSEVIQTLAAQVASSYGNALQFNRIDSALTQRGVQLGILADIGRELTALRDLETLYQRMLENALSGTGSYAGALLIQHETLKIVASVGYPNRLEPLGGLTVRAFHEKTPMVVGDVSQIKGFKPSAAITQSQLSIPILRGNEAIGVITLESDKSDAYNEDDVIFVTQLVSQGQVAMDNIQLLNNIAEGRDRLQVILDSMTEAIILIEAQQGRIALVNPMTETLLGLAPYDLIGRRVADLLDDVLSQRLGFKPEELRQALDKLAAGEYDTLRQEYEIGEPQLRYIQRTSAPVVGSSGNLLGLLYVFTDTTEEMEIRQTREQMTSMIVHDLRSPLTAVKASLRLLREVADPADSVGDIIMQTTDVSGRAVRKLLNMVNSLLDISKMESGVISLERDTMGLVPLVNSVISELQPLAEEMEVNLESALNGSLPILDIDGDKIERVLYNLVDNAIKFTPNDGRVSIHATDGDQRGMLRVEVRDTGPGVPDDYKVKLFERYQQVEGRRGRRQGTGLGLTFCKLAVEAHGGRIWVEDNPAGGSVFAFTLPLAMD